MGRRRVRRGDLRAGAGTRRGPLAGGREPPGPLRPGGRAIVSTPFLVRVHEEPLYGMKDYWRFTPRGLRLLLERAGLEVDEVRSWGNRDCVAGNFDGGPRFAGGIRCGTSPICRCRCGRSRAGLIEGPPPQGLAGDRPPGRGGGRPGRGVRDRGPVPPPGCPDCRAGGGGRGRSLKAQPPGGGWAAGRRRGPGGATAAASPGWRWCPAGSARPRRRQPGCAPR